MSDEKQNIHENMNTNVPLPISVKLAYVHQSATKLTSDDIVKVEYALKALIEQAMDALEDVRLELRIERMRQKEEGRRVAA